MTTLKSLTSFISLHLIVLLVSSATGLAIEEDLKVTSTTHVSVFPESGKGDQQDSFITTELKPDLALTFDESWQAIIAPRFRFGLTDPEYGLLSLDDLYTEYVSDSFEVRVGYQTHFWGAAESSNIVDILNQKDFVIDFFDPMENKFGEPAIRLRLSVGENQFDIYHFSYFTPASLPNKVNRFNFFDGQLDFSNDPIYTHGDKRLRQQAALRWDRTIGSADIGISYFNGYEKFPVIHIRPGAVEADTLYYEMQQFSGDIQMPVGNWLLKGEALFQDTSLGGTFIADSVTSEGKILRRNLVPKNHTAFVGGFEYTFYGVIGQSDIGLIGEYLYDSEQRLDAVAFRPFQNDAFGGIRWSRNNSGDGALLIGGIVDMRNQTQVWRAEYSERFFDRLILSANYDHINATPEDPIAIFDNDNRLAIELSYTY
tara:strand:- start:955 stop:2235 length:1281 start_codon:yes stop_codon:yes gene_type:complete